MYVLFLNKMTSSNVETLQKVCRAETKEALLNFIKQEETEPYRDEGWYKVYKKGGPLEWFNPPYDFDEHLHFRDFGTLTDRLKELEIEWNEFMSETKEVF